VLAFPPGITTFSRLEPAQSGGEDCQFDEAIQWGVLSFAFKPDAPEMERPAFIVDGQHRLFSMAEVQDEQVPVLVSALLNAEPDEQAFQFIVINNKVTRVPTDLVRSLIVDFNEDALQKRLETARVSLQPQALLVAIVDDEPESPFYQMVNWERRRNEGNPAIKPAAIEDSLKYIRRRFLQLDEDQDALIDFFFALWQGVKEAYPELWENCDNRLFENAGFKAFSEYLCDQIETLSSMDIGFVDIEDKESVSSATRQIAAQINSGFWLATWRLKSLDTSSGRETVKEDLKTIRKNRKEHKHWSEGLSLVGIQAETEVVVA
jgi:DGQHR domain-containing protein